MKQRLLFLILLLVLVEANAQRRVALGFLEAGVLFGATNYSGDLAERIVELSETKLGFGFFARYQFRHKWSCKLHAYSGSITGDDANSPVLYDRKFKFSTNITETAVVLEYSPWGKPRFSRTGLRNLNLSPYIFVGMGVTFAVSTTQYYGPPEKRNNYLRASFPEDNLDHRFVLMPNGVGLKAHVFDRFILGLDWGWRPVFSDDLDGVRLNGNPKKSDWYYFAGLTVSFLLAGK